MAGLTTCWTIHLIKIQLNGFHTALVRGMLAVLCFTLALEALRMPVVQCMDKKSTMTMLADERIDHTQQSIIKRYLCLHLGKYLFIPDTRIEQDHEQYFVPTYYDECKYYKEGNKMPVLGARS